MPKETTDQPKQVARLAIAATWLLLVCSGCAPENTRIEFVSTSFSMGFAPSVRRSVSILADGSVTCSKGNLPDQSDPAPRPPRVEKKKISSWQVVRILSKARDIEFFTHPDGSAFVADTIPNKLEITAGDEQRSRAHHGIPGDGFSRDLSELGKMIESHCL